MKIQARFLHGVMLLFPIARWGFSGFCLTGIQENTQFLLLQESGRDLATSPRYFSDQVEPRRANPTWPTNHQLYYRHHRNLRFHSLGSLPK
jgi:hypothetical protein